MTSPEGAVEPGRYAAVWVKQGGKWLINCLRDLPEAQGDEPAAAGKLKPLAWMVGEWEARDGEVRMRCRWLPNQAFLMQEFTASRKDGEEFRATQIIGWDAYEEKLRSWLFDSSGGFGGGFWSRQGNTWEAQSEGVFPDGRIGSAVNRWKFIDENTVEWSSHDRQADETPLPDLKATFVRKAKAQ
jgi:hypothetical protein